MNEVVLVDNNDNQVGTAGKLEAHQNGGVLHRAFSVFVFNSYGQLLMQQRALNKYHAGGLWSNTCCSHPAPGEDVEEAARRRLMEEMGFTCPLDKVFEFTYTADVGNGLTEREYDHVFVGLFDGEPDPDPKEVFAWRWVDTDFLKRDIRDNPDRYTPWFGLALAEGTWRSIMKSLVGRGAG